METPDDVFWQGRLADGERVSMNPIQGRSTLSSYSNGFGIRNRKFPSSSVSISRIDRSA